MFFFNLKLILFVNWILFVFGIEEIRRRCDGVWDLKIERDSIEIQPLEMEVVRWGKLCYAQINVLRMTQNLFSFFNYFNNYFISVNGFIYGNWSLIKFFIF